MRKRIIIFLLLLNLSFVTLNSISVSALENEAHIDGIFKESEFYTYDSNQKIITINQENFKTEDFDNFLNMDNIVYKRYYNEFEKDYHGDITNNLKLEIVIENKHEIINFLINESTRYDRELVNSIEDKASDGSSTEDNIMKNDTEILTLISDHHPALNESNNNMMMYSISNSNFSRPLMRNNLDISMGWMDYEGHRGIDLVGSVGTPIYSVQSGTVVDIETNCSPGNRNCGRQWGNFVKIKHANGTHTLYAHMSEVSVSMGQSVRKSEFIGRIGMTGYTTGPHLHFEVYENGTRVNPYPYLSNAPKPQGWIMWTGKWTYYFGSENDYATGWKQISNKWYYFNSAGYMQTGWQKVKDKWYYMASDGSMQTGWQKVKDKWYYMASDGSMQTGWKKINDKWYYMTSDGAMQTGWKKINDKWYYLNSSGIMATNTIIDGWVIDSSGVASKK